MSKRGIARDPYITARKPFNDQVALVTGGAGGIGSALARELVRAGVRLAIADLDAGAAEDLGRELGALGLAMDVTDQSSVSSTVDEVANRLGPISILFNVAGVVGGRGPLLSLPVEALERAFDVNVKGVFLVTQAVAARMVATGRGGAIVNVGSCSAMRPAGVLAHYGASKAAVHALTQAAAVEFAPHQIRVNAVAPGPVYTPMNRETMDSPEHRAEWESRIPLGHIAMPDDLVPLLIFLASDDARNMTGAIVAIDGGLIAL